MYTSVHIHGPLCAHSTVAPIYKRYGPYIHCVSKNVSPLTCYNFDKVERILMFFGRNVIGKVSYKSFTICHFKCNLCFCTIPGKTGKHENRIFTQKDAFSLSALPEFNQLLDFLNIFTHDSYSRCTAGLLKSCTQCVQLRSVGIIACSFIFIFIHHFW